MRNEIRPLGRGLIESGLILVTGSEPSTGVTQNEDQGIDNEPVRM